MTEREEFEKAFLVPDGIEWINDEQGYRITSDDDYWFDSKGQAHFKGFIGQWIGWQAARAQGGEAVAWSWVSRGRHVTVDKSHAEELRADGELVVPLYAHPSASVPEKRFPVGGLDHGWRGKYNEGWNDCVDAMLATTPQPADDSLQEIANKVCGHAPEGWIISFCMENGAAWVEASRPDGEAAELPDSADQTLVEQINDALCVAKGWTNPPAEGADR